MGCKISRLVGTERSTMVARTENLGSTCKRFEAGRGGQMQCNSVDDTYSWEDASASC